METPELLSLCISSCSGSCTDCIGIQDGVAVLIFSPTLHATRTFGCCKSQLLGSLIFPKQIPILLKLLSLSVNRYIIFKFGAERTKKSVSGCVHKLILRTVWRHPMRTGIAPHYSQFSDRKDMLIDSQMTDQGANSITPSVQ